MSKSKHYVYSTLANDNRYQNYGQGGADIQTELGEGVLIHGGANVPDKRLITPQGVVTPVTSDQLEYLRANPVFKVHEKNGFIVVSADKVDPEVAAADMEGRDQSAPVVPADYEAVGEKPPEQAEAVAAPRNPRRA